MEIEVLLGDITKLKVDAIVNPANSFITMGGGLAGIIRKVGGEAIKQEAQKQVPVAVGKAIITKAGNLPCNFVIHAPTMEKPAMKIPSKNVELAMSAILKCADENDLNEIAIPGLGTGVGAVPYEEAAKIMINSAKKFKAENLKKIIFIDKNKSFYEELMKLK